MGLLQGLLGSQREEFDDFVNRYDQGAPWDGISQEEAVSRYQQVATQVPPDVYEQSAEEAFSRLSPQQRVQLGQYLRRQGRERNLPVADFDQDGIEDRFQDPRQLARMTSQIDQRQPGLLGQLLGGGGGTGGQGGMLENPIAKAALAGIAAMAVKRMAGGR
jgi:hypothetical protein